MRQIALKLNEHGHLRSQASGQSVEATVAVTLDDLGRLVSTRVVKKTGTPQLDEAALGVIRSAQPFPPPPAELGKRSLELAVALVFGKTEVSSAVDLNPANDAVSEWKRQVLVHLSRHQRFPPEACERGGIAGVTFTLNRSGTLISADLARTGGVQPLDVEALAIVKGAQPYPAPPLETSDDQLKVAVELKFEEPAGTVCQYIRQERQVRGRMQGICRGC
jgi:TonB family protein